MNQKIVIDIEKPVNGEVLIWKDGKLITKNIRALLPELKKIKELENKICDLEEKVALLIEQVKELRGED